MLTFENKSNQMDLPNYFKLLLIKLVIKLETSFNEFPKEARGFMLGGVAGPAFPPIPLGRGFHTPRSLPTPGLNLHPPACNARGTVSTVSTVSFGGKKILHGKK